MKRSALLGLLILALALPVFSVDVSSELKASSFAMTKDGDFNPEIIRYGCSFEISDSLSPTLYGKLAFDSDPVNGTILSSRAMYRTSYMEISAGPSFGVLNTTGSAEGVPILFQPGLGIGFNVTVPGIVVASADTEFALPAAVQTEGQVYLQKSELSAGFFLPNVLCSAHVSQRNASAYDGGASKMRSATDYGLYTTAYKKGSPIRVSLNFIYRIIDFYIAPDNASNRKIANLVLGGGFTVTPSAEYSLFVDANGALYSFSLADPDSGLDQFMFDIRAGMKLSIDRTPSWM